MNHPDRHELRESALVMEDMIKALEFNELKEKGPNKSR
jgi:hypothetical protein